MAKHAPKKTLENQRDMTGKGPPLRPPAGKEVRRLGKGLQALLGDGDVLHSITSHGTAGTTAGAGDGMLAIDKIVPSAWQPRQDFDKHELAELAHSIKSHGMLQPLLVRPHGEKAGYFELIAGERRWRAAGLGQIHAVPVVIRQASDEQAAEIALIENIQRRDLNAIEEGMGYRQLMDAFGHTQEELAAILGKSRAHLANCMRLLNLPASVKDMVMGGVLTAGQARPLIGREDAADLAKLIAHKGMTSRAVELMLANMKNGKSTRKTGVSGRAADANIKALEDSLADALGLAVAVDFNPNTARGSIRIQFASHDQLASITQRLMH